MMCNSGSGIGIGIGFQGFSGMMELESELNWRLKSLEGIGIGIELRPCGIGIGICRFQTVMCGSDSQYADIKKKCRYCRCRYKYRHTRKSRIDCTEKLPALFFWQ